MEKMTFIHLIADGAVAGWFNYRILPSVKMAQAILESGWGDHHIHFNLFGIKADSSWTGPVTQTSNGTYRSYDSFNESILDHSLFLTSMPRYAGVLGVTDYKKVCQGLQDAHYAGNETTYAGKLIEVIDDNNLTAYDKKAGVGSSVSAGSVSVYTPQSASGGDAMNGFWTESSVKALSAGDDAFTFTQGRPFLQENGLTLTIDYGRYKPDGRKNRDVLKKVFLRTLGTEYDASGTPISRIYGFVAQDVIKE